ERRFDGHEFVPAFVQADHLDADPFDFLARAAARPAGLRRRLLALHVDDEPEQHAQRQRDNPHHVGIPEPSIHHRATSIFSRTATPACPSPWFPVAILRTAWRSAILP